MKPARDRILAAADRIHASKGASALSLRAVARAVGITPMAIYRHFKDKDDLLDALAAAGFDKLEGYFAAAVRARTPLKALERVLLAYGDFAMAEPRAFELMFLIPRTVPEAPASLRTSPSPSFETLISGVREAIESGTIAAGDPAEIILLCWATVHGLVALHLTGRFGYDDARFRRLYAGTVKRLLSTLTVRQKR